MIIITEKVNKKRAKKNSQKKWFFLLPPQAGILPSISGLHQKRIWQFFTSEQDFPKNITYSKEHFVFHCWSKAQAVEKRRDGGNFCGYFTILNVLICLPENKSFT